MDTNRRLLLAVLLTFLVLTVYQWMLPKPPPSTAGPTAGSPSTKTTSGQTADANSAAVASAASPSAPAQPAIAPAETVVGERSDRTIAVNNGVIHAEFSNRGGTLVSWQLLKFHDSAGRAVDLVPHDVPPDSAEMFSLRLDDSAKTAHINSALFASTAPNTPLDATSTPAAITFEYQDAAGLHVRKQFQLDPNSYVLSLTTTVTDGDRALNPWIELGPGLGDVVALPPGGRYVRRAEAIQSTAGKVARISAATLKTTPNYQGSYEFAGVDTHYFIAAAIKPGAVKTEYHPLSLEAPNVTPAISRDYVTGSIQPSQPGTLRFYVGPKELGALRAVDPQMVPAIWFGMFSFLTVPMLSALNWINGFVGNYGWSILVLTLIINLVMFPLRHKSLVSMRKMQDIQPQVKTIQDRYAKLKMSDPARQKMNTELMDLYRSKGVNPASGCIPMILTMPVLFAFYNLLSEAIELRGAPFMLWIHDLSVADPYYVTPIVMGITQLVQQRMTPAAADPAQQKMMMIMPVVFTFLFITAPSGLALYWAASNALNIGQQLLTNRLIGPPDVRVPRPPSERRLKKVGEGKTEEAQAL